MSSTSGTPSKGKSQPSQDDEPAGRVRRGRKTTEEEEGEIVSDPSDTESKRADKRRRYSSSNKKGDIERDFGSDQSDSESRKSDKQRKYSSSRVADTSEKPKEEEIGSDLTDSEDRKQGKYSSLSKYTEPIEEGKGDSKSY